MITSRHTRLEPAALAASASTGHI